MPCFHSMHSILPSISKFISKLLRLWKMSTLSSSLLIALRLRSLWGQRDKQTVKHSRLKFHWNMLKWLSCVFYQSLMVLAVSPWNSGAQSVLNAFIYTYTLYKRMNKKLIYCCLSTACKCKRILPFTYSFMLLKGKPQLPTCRDNPSLTAQKPRLISL